METTKLIEKMRATAKQYETPPCGREVDDTVELLREAADKLEARKTPAAPGGTDNVRMLLNALADGECKGVKGATAYKIAQFAQKKGFIVENGFVYVDAPYDDDLGLKIDDRYYI